MMKKSNCKAPNRLIAKLLSIVLIGGAVLSLCSGCGSAAKDIEIDYCNPTETIDNRIEALLSQMTLEEKVAQMVQAEQAYITPEDIRKYGIGSVLSGGGSAPATGNSPQDWADRINELKKGALESRLGIPLLYGVDAVHGNNNVYGTTIFPHNIGLGATHDAELVERIGAATAKEVRAVGAQWTFAPTLGNPQNILWGRTYECFGEDTELVSELGTAYVRGFQGELGSEEYLDEEHVIATAKHYLGEGYTEHGINQGNVDMSEEEFDELLESGVLDPYEMTVKEGVRTVMVTYNSVDGLKSSENYHLITEVLKGTLGFDGIVVSDYYAIEQTSGASYKDQVILCVNAGMDLFMEIGTWKEFMDTLLQAVEEGSVSESRIDDAVTRILRVKFEAGLFEEEVESFKELELLQEIGNEENRELAREAVRESLVLLKNGSVGSKTAIEALGDVENLVVAGSKANDIGAQCGGWTISWQGSSGNTTIGTPVIQGIAMAAPEEITIMYSPKGLVAESTEAVIAVIGEVPYAEMNGDRVAGDSTLSADDIMMLEQLTTSLAENEKSDIPVVAIILAGRPVELGEYAELFDGIVMAWLPGTEAEGIGDVLYGEYDFTGTLTYTWADSTVNEENKFTDSSVVLYEKGFGIRKDGCPIQP